MTAFSPAISPSPRTLPIERKYQSTPMIGRCDEGDRSPRRQDPYPAAPRSSDLYWIASDMCAVPISAAPSRSAMVRAILRTRW